MTRLNPEVYFDSQCPNTEIVKVINRYIDENKISYTRNQSFPGFSRVKTNTYFKYRKILNTTTEPTSLTVDNVNFYKLCLFLKTNGTPSVSVGGNNDYKMFDVREVEDNLYKVIIVFNDFVKTFDPYSVQISVTDGFIEDVTGVMF